MSHPRITIRDVAARAGVSHQTVSRVINHSPLVSSPTRAHVEAVIADLGYAPNAIARFMAWGRTGALACLSPNLTDYTFASLIEGAQAEARQQGYFLLSASAADVETFAALVSQFVTSRQTEGLMVINPYADARHTLLPPDFPTVFAGARPRAEAANSVALDDVGAARLATEHLLSLGHRAIGMVTGPLTEDCAQDRCLGFEQTLQAAGLSPRPEWIAAGDWLAPSGCAAFERFLNTGRLPTAIFAQNDQMALGILHAARAAGLSLPSQLSVVGVDDIPLVAYYEPPLTTVRQDFQAIGRAAARFLIQALKQPTAPRQHLQLPGELVIRQSATFSAENPIPPAWR